ncbi:terpene cyclase/mutase family protein [Streptomyces durbertensis]|uniref:Terpene cyclase/mutase family protein n=1 Tax=Streptomyces durbertensis TaxID=2448886 RepID=A0ABR6EHU0_9ACTN|nr:prenyltransferase/squalene oxidase repeat-containing protein [Streptomyces durbertensis]MBB1244637.1 terpene cyclase/mutase family protein [Streptomyces durbertensis]
MFLRRSAALLATTVVLGTAGALGAPAAVADESPSPKLPSGLYGKADPQYDGVFRQSTALLAQDAAGVVPARKAVNWLAEQQCDGGAFPAYRADSTEPCPAKLAADTNATGLAVQALAVLGGHGEVVKDSVAWLKTVQNKDGGWGYNPGSASDANSTAIVVGALAAAGEKPEDVRSKNGDRSPYDALDSFQLGCDAKAAERGAFAYQPGEDDALAPNDLATVAATVAARGAGLASVAKDAPAAENIDVEAPTCGAGDRYARADVADAASAYLVRALDANEGRLDSSMPGSEDQPDFGTTTQAALALAQGGHLKAAEQPLGWLETNYGKWPGVEDNPAALGQLVLAVHASGGNPADFGGVDLLERLNATGPEPAEAAKPADGDGDQADAAEKDSAAPVMWLLGVGVLAGVGIGLLMSLRKKKQQGGSGDAGSGKDE